MAVIEFPQRSGESRYQVFGQGGSLLQNNRLVLLLLGVLNAVLLIAAIAIAVNCAKVSRHSLQVSHPAVERLINELDDFRSNHSYIREAEDAAWADLVATRERYTQMKLKIEQLKASSDDYQKQMMVLQAEKSALKSNTSLLDGSCGMCPAGWSLFNNSCYFFSYSEAPNKKLDWHDSRENCIQRGADLVIVDDPEEQFFISSIIKNKKSSSRWWENGFWMGITDIVAEGKWVWINNVTEVEQRYWKEGEPNDNGRMGEDCGVAISSPRSPWETRYDGSCQNFVLHWICEMPRTQNVN